MVNTEIRKLWRDVTAQPSLLGDKSTKGSKITCTFIGQYLSPYMSWPIRICLLSALTSGFENKITRSTPSFASSSLKVRNRLLLINLRNTVKEYLLQINNPARKFDLVGLGKRCQNYLFFGLSFTKTKFEWYTPTRHKGF